MALRDYVSNATAYAHVFMALSDGPCTIVDLEKESGLSKNTIRKLVACLKRHKRLHVAAWEKDKGGRWTLAAYQLTDVPMKDVQRPAPLTPTQRSANRNARNRMARLALARAKTSASAVETVDG